MLDYLIVAVIVAAAAIYTFRSLFRAARGKKSCCSNAESCQMVDFMKKNNPGGKAIKCEAESGLSGVKSYREFATGKRLDLSPKTPRPE
ncbi:MAG: hypothetical protein A3F83_07690 [Candidatus Glassbacteria bacterium RIFCSPLOWO2_12_FULL_58_11]|uniref:FeoB-associated Cys-rich membrane protein n=2 Tax=Candidatus Glassiibacteriota TaxID=1817805 RepID=A0A1F5Z2E6_9BACT|nr:MAG: hypothetical protein A2Z86_07485 [Candidatus Glassbacteria bacterium GWA2_58_10]OGG06628.1 MAG: hypothetical protein A3F83_07690 [Candidatus Glassbacteria bacterium RIFCSPLOWO2_12_FULL_58_11]